MWKAPEIDVAKGGGDVSKGEHDVESTGERCGCSRILMGTVMEGDVKSAGGFPLEAEDDVAVVEKDVGAAVGGLHFKLPDYFVRVVRRLLFSIPNDSLDSWSAPSF